MSHIGQLIHSHETAPGASCSIEAPSPQAPRASIPAAKRKFYWPGKAGRDETKNLVGRVRVPVTGYSKTNTVQGIHYAWAYQQLSAKDFFRDVQDKKSIEYNFADHVLHDVAKEFDERLSASSITSQCFIDNKHFGAWLCDMATAMQAQKVDEVKATLLALDKPLVVKLCWKTDKATGAKRICVTCYDPKITLNHHRIEADSAQGLRGRTLTEGFERAGKYCIAGNEAAAWTSASWSGVSLDSSDELRYFNLGPDNVADTAAALSLAMGISSPSLVKALGTQLRDAGRSSLAEMKIALGLNSSSRRFWALSKGKAETARALATALREIKLPQDLLRPFLKIIGEKGLPSAMKRGHADAIRAYGGLLELLPGLRYSEKLPLVGVDPSGTGTPLLFIAADHMQPAAIEAYGDLLYSLGIRGECAVELLRALSPDGTPALHRIFQRGCAKSLWSYCKVLRRLDVPMDRVEDLLWASDKTGTPAFSHACATANAPMIAVYGDGLQHLGVPKKMAANLLIRGVCVYMTADPAPHPLPEVYYEILLRAGGVSTSPNGPPAGVHGTAWTLPFSDDKEEECGMILKDAI